MRKAVLAGLGLVSVLTLPASAAGTSGPFAGTVRQGEARAHLFDNNPSKQPCLDIATTYRVSLSHVPTSDTLTLSVAGVPAVVTSGGGASVTFQRGVCAQFTVSVSGTAVADQAAYVVSVRSGLLATGIDITS